MPVAQHVDAAVAVEREVGVPDARRRHGPGPRSATASRRATGAAASDEGGGDRARGEIGHAGTLAQQS